MPDCQSVLEEQEDTNNIGFALPTTPNGTIVPDQRLGKVSEVLLPSPTTSASHKSLIQSNEFDWC
jgi:hypothetical protein